MLDLNLMATFARVVEAESFSEAARRLATSPSAVSKTVAKLEKTLGARLINRTTLHLMSHRNRPLDHRVAPLGCR